MSSNKNKSKGNVKNKKIDINKYLIIIAIFIILIFILKYIVVRICFYNLHLNYGNINIIGFIKSDGDEIITIEDSNNKEYIEFENLKIKNNFKEYINIKENKSNSKFYFKNEENIIEDNYKSVEYTFVDSDKKENIILEIINKTEIDMFKDSMKSDLKMSSLEVNNYLIQNDIYDDLDLYKHLSDEIFTFDYNKKIISLKEINRINFLTYYANKYKKETIFIEGKYEGYISRLGNNYQIYIWDEDDRYMIKVNFSNDKYNKEYVLDLVKSIVIE